MVIAAFSAALLVLGEACFKGYSLQHHGLGFTTWLAWVQEFAPGCYTQFGLLMVSLANICVFFFALDMQQWVCFCSICTMQSNLY